MYFIASKQLCIQSLREIGLIQIVEKATHIQGGLLDHVYIIQGEKITYSYSVGNFPKYYSDHDGIGLILSEIQEDQLVKFEENMEGKYSEKVIVVNFNWKFLGETGPQDTKFGWDGGIKLDFENLALAFGDFLKMFQQVGQEEFIVVKFKWKISTQKLLARRQHRISNIGEPVSGNPLGRLVPQGTAEIDKTVVVIR